MADKNKWLLYEKQAEFVKAIAHPVRTAILDCLSSGGKCVCDIAEAVGSERSNVSRHLGVMTTAGVLSSRKEGLNVIYSVRTKCVLDFVSCVSRCLREQLKDSSKLMAMCESRAGK